MIDIHLHILPGVDDGPATLQESLVLAQALVQEGVQVVVATPHSNDEYPRLPATEIRTRVNQLQHVLMQQGLPLHVFAGNEVLIRAGLVDEIRAGSVATLNGGRYLLLELWNTMWLPETEQVIFGLLSQGIVPIIAHPERYTTIQKDPSRLIALIRQGALAQLTASSVLGLHGSTVKRTAETLLKQGLIHFLASDAHGMHRRPPYMAKSLKQIETLVGAERVRLMTETWPTAIVKNEWVNAHIETHMQVGNSEKRHFLQFWH